MCYSEPSLAAEMFWPSTRGRWPHLAALRRKTQQSSWLVVACRSAAAVTWRKSTSKGDLHDLEGCRGQWEVAVNHPILPSKVAGVIMSCPHEHMQLHVLACLRVLCLINGMELAHRAPCEVSGPMHYTGTLCDYVSVCASNGGSNWPPHSPQKREELIWFP